jgi:hypothetical protein
MEMIQRIKNLEIETLILVWKPNSLIARAIGDVGNLPRALLKSYTYK